MKNLYKYLRDKLGRDLTEAEMKEAREAVRKDAESTCDVVECDHDWVVPQSLDTTVTTATRKEVCRKCEAVRWVITGEKGYLVTS
jgi:hypothetical protein